MLFCCLLSFTSVVVYFVYLSIQMNLANYYYCFTIHMTTLDRIGKKYTVSKVPFSRKLGIWHTILINSPFIFEQYLGDSSLVGCLAQKPSFMPKLLAIPYLLIIFLTSPGYYPLST